MTNSPYPERETGGLCELRRLAEAATPGPWKACGTIYEHMNCEVRSGAKGEGSGIAQVWEAPNAFADGQFIAAANPAVVLALLNERAEASSTIRALVEQNVAQAAELERLRGALREIEALPNMSRDPVDDFDRGARAARLDAADIAARALKTEGASNDR